MIWGYKKLSFVLNAYYKIILKNLIYYNYIHISDLAMLPKI